MKGVWLQLGLHQAHLIPLAVEHGFEFHHAHKQHVVMTAWLPSEPNRLPSHTTHQVGVGVVIRNERGDIVVVKERHGPAAKYDIWKVPTGILDDAEDFQDAAVREVKEETVRLANILSGDDVP